MVLFSAAFEAATAKIVELESTIESLKAELATAQEQVSEFSQQVETLRGENETLNNSIAEYAAEREAREDERKNNLVNRYQNDVDEEEINSIREHLKDFSYEQLESKLAATNTELEYLKEKTIPREDYVSLQNKLENEIISRDNELKHLKEQTIPKEEYLKLQSELNRKNDKIKRLEEINAFFNELQEEQEAYDTMEVTPPFRLEKKQGR